MTRIRRQPQRSQQTQRSHHSQGTQAPRASTSPQTRGELDVDTLPFDPTSSGPMTVDRSLPGSGTGLLSFLGGAAQEHDATPSLPSAQDARFFGRVRGAGTELEITVQGRWDPRRLASKTGARQFWVRGKNSKSWRLEDAGTLGDRDRRLLRSGDRVRFTRPSFVGAGAPQMQHAMDQTLAVAAKTLDPPHMQALKKELGQLKQRFLAGDRVSLKDFDRRCTQARKTWTQRQVMAMSGEDYLKWAPRNRSRPKNQYGMYPIRNGSLLKTLGLKRGFDEDPNFLDKRIYVGPDQSGPTYRQTIDRAIDQAIAGAKDPSFLRQHRPQIRDAYVKKLFAESRGDPLATSSTYCPGLAQSESSRYNKPVDKGGYNPFNPIETIGASAREYVTAIERRHQQTQNFDLAIDMAVVEHNAGRGAVNRAIRQGGLHGWIEKLPRAESRNYLRAVQQRYQDWRGALGRDPLTTAPG